MAGIEAVVVLVYLSLQKNMTKTKGFCERFREISRIIKTRATLFIFREKPAAKTLVSGLFSGFYSNEYAIFGAIWIQSKILFPPTK